MYCKGVCRGVSRRGGMAMHLEGKMKKKGWRIGSEKKSLNDFNQRTQKNFRSIYAPCSPNNWYSNRGQDK